MTHPPGRAVMGIIARPNNRGGRRIPTQPPAVGTSRRDPDCRVSFAGRDGGKIRLVPPSALVHLRSCAVGSAMMVVGLTALWAQGTAAASVPPAVLGVV